MRIAIIGAAELGKLIMHHAIHDSGFEVVGFYDDFSKNSEFNDRPVLGNTARIQEDFSKGLFDQLMVAIGYNHMNARKDAFERFKGKIPFANIIHSSAYVDNSCIVGEGNFLLPGVVVDCGAIIHDNVLMNAGTIVAHHTEIFSHCFIAPGVTIAGLVKVEECCFVGLGSIVKDCITLAHHSVIGAGAVVLKNTEAGTTSIGIPARAINAE